GDLLTGRPPVIVRLEGEVLAGRLGGDLQIELGDAAVAGDDLDQFSHVGTTSEGGRHPELVPNQLLAEVSPGDGDAVREVNGVDGVDQESAKLPLDVNFVPGGRVGVVQPPIRLGDLVVPQPLRRGRQSFRFLPDGTGAVTARL